MAGLEVPEYVDGESLVPQLNDPLTPMGIPAITSWGRGNYAVRSNDWRYIQYFDGTEELYDHNSDMNEWHNRANDPESDLIKNELKKYLPVREAALNDDYIQQWSVEGADKALLKKDKK